MRDRVAGAVGAFGRALMRGSERVLNVAARMESAAALELRYVRNALSGLGYAADADIVGVLRALHLEVLERREADSDKDALNAEIERLKMENRRVEMTASEAKEALRCQREMLDDLRQVLGMPEQHGWGDVLRAVRELLKKPLPADRAADHGPPPAKKGKW